LWGKVPHTIAEIAISLPNRRYSALFYGDTYAVILITVLFWLIKVGRKNEITYIVHLFGVPTCALQQHSPQLLHFP